MGNFSGVNERDLLHGSIWKKLALFAFPIAISSILQQFFNAADMAIVGQYNGTNALAAVGSNGFIVNLLVNTFTGLSIGANVVLAKCIGAGDTEKAEKTVHTTMLVALVGGIVLSGVGVLIADPILRLTATPDDVMPLASLYLRIYFLGLPFILVYNFGAAILRSVGDTKRPFLCLTLAGVLNVILNFLFVAVFDWSVAGVAIATVISNLFSSSLVIIFLLHETGVIRLSLRKLKITGVVLREIVKVGLPAGLQSMLFSISNIYIQTATNTLGTKVMAGSAAELNYDWIAYYMVSGFSQACLTFTGQNYGAGNIKRCKEIAYWSVLWGIVTSGLLSVVFYLFRYFFLGFYESDPVVIQYGIERMYFVLLPTCICSFTEIVAGSIRGLGYSLPPTIIILLGSCLLRVVWMYTVFAHYQSYQALLWIFPVTWVATGTSMPILWGISMRRARRRLADEIRAVEMSESIH